MTVALSQATLVSVHPKEPPGCLLHFLSSPRSLVFTASGTWGKAPAHLPTQSHSWSCLPCREPILSLPWSPSHTPLTSQLQAHWYLQQQICVLIICDLIVGSSWTPSENLSLNPQPSYSVLRILSNASQSILPLVCFVDSNYLWDPLGIKIDILALEP